MLSGGTQPFEQCCPQILRRAATLLDLPVSAFAELCGAYGRPLSYDLPG